MQTSKPKGVAREAQRYELTGVPTSTWYDLQNAGLAPRRQRSSAWMATRREGDATVTVSQACNYVMSQSVQQERLAWTLANLISARSKKSAFEQAGKLRWRLQKRRLRAWGSASRSKRSLATANGTPSRPSSVRLERRQRMCGPPSISCGDGEPTRPNASARKSALN